MRLTDAELVERLRRDQESVRLLEARLAKSAIPEDAWDHGDDLAAFKLRAALVTELLELRAALTEIEVRARFVLARHDPGEPVPLGASAAIKTGAFAKDAARELVVVAGISTKALQEPT